jgi:hypothetical protein
MRRRLARVATAGALGLALSGCFGPGGSWQLPSFMRPPPPAPTTHYYQPSAGGEINNNPPTIENEEPHEHVRSRRPPEREVPAAVATPAPPVQPVPKPTVTLADGPSKERAQRLLDDAGAKLAKVHRDTLGADSATTYDQANNFLQAGRKAATEDDYVAASGFAEKAAVLAAKLVPASR